LLTDKAQAIRTHASVVAEKSALVDSLRSTVLKQLKLLDQTLPASDSLLGDLIASSEGIISFIETANRKREDVAQKLADLKEKLFTVQEEVTQAASDLQKWTYDWAEAVAVVGLKENATPSEASSVVQSVNELLVLLKESASLVDRIAGVDRDAGGFKDEVQGVIAAVAPDLSSLSVDLAVSDLSDRLSAATGAQATLDEWKKQLGQEESKRNKARLVVDPKLAAGDGALGFWKALAQVFPSTREQRCWVHKTANVLDKLPERLQPEAKEKLHAIWMAETREDAGTAFDLFLDTYRAKYSKATECLTKDRDALLAFYDFPAEHWIHLRTTNPIESVFATVRLRHRRTKGNGSRTACLAMVFKLMQSAEKRWRLLNGSNLLVDVIAGVSFTNGIKQAA